MILRRSQTWQVDLIRYLVAEMARSDPFAVNRNDCFTFGLGAIDAMCHSAEAKAWAGSFSSLLSLNRMTRRLGHSPASFLRSHLKARGLIATTPARCIVGDVAIRDQGVEVTVGIRGPAEFITRGKCGKLVTMSVVDDVWHIQDRAHG